MRPGRDGALRGRGHRNAMALPDPEALPREGWPSPSGSWHTARVIRWFEHRQIYAPSPVLDAAPELLGRPFEEVWFTASDGVRLHGWFFPADAGSPRAEIAFMLLHGNAGNISHRLPFYEAWLGLGVNVFAFDYRGFGRSEGRATEEGTYRDAQAAAAWLRARGFAPERIVAIGKSLGGGVASELALREPLGGLILHNTFTSIPDVGAELFPWLPVRRLHTIRYDTVAKLPRIVAPVLVMHSPEDDLIGFHHGERNFAAARDPKMFWKLAGAHNAALDADRAQYLAGLEKFLATHLNGATTAVPPTPKPELIPCPALSCKKSSCRPPPNSCAKPSDPCPA